MDIKKAADGTVDETELSKDLQDLTVDDSHRATQTANGKKRKNHRGGQKKKQKNSQKSSKEAIQASEGDAPVQLYEVRATASKGLGVFASCAIPRGTRIMCEPALLYIEHANLQFMHVLFYRLSPGDQAKFLSLHAHFLKGEKAAMEKVLRAFKAADPILFAPPIEDQLRILAVVKSNGCKTNCGVAVPYDLGRINHSCLPNVYHVWNNGK